MNFGHGTHLKYYGYLTLGSSRAAIARPSLSRFVTFNPDGLVCFCIQALRIQTTAKLWILYNLSHVNGVHSLLDGGVFTVPS